MSFNADILAVRVGGTGAGALGDYASWIERGVIINKNGVISVSTTNTPIVSSGTTTGWLPSSALPTNSELIVNGNFLTATSLNGWSVSSAGGFSLSKGLNLNSRQINVPGRDTVYSACSQTANIFEIGKTYKLVIEGLNITSGSIELKFGRSHNTNPPRPNLTKSNNGTYEDTFIALNQNDGFTINSKGNTVASLSSISIKEVLAAPTGTNYNINVVGAKDTTINWASTIDFTEIYTNVDLNPKK
jgi:hypothetical protein